MVTRTLLPLLPLVLLLSIPSQAQVLFSGQCPRLKPMPHFDPARFLGRWYEIARFFASFEGIAGTCWVENYKFHPKRGSFTVLEWKDHLSGRVLTVENGISHDLHHPALLRYALQRPNLPFLRGEYRILDTDYKNYALAWQCDDLPLGVANTQILWFLSKDQYPEPELVKRVKHLTHQFGLDPTHFEFQDRRKCPY